MGVAPNAVPMGMQVVGNTFDDLAAFRVGVRIFQSRACAFTTGALFPDFRDSAQG